MSNCFYVSKLETQGSGLKAINDLVTTSLSLYHHGSVAQYLVKPNMFYGDTNADALKNKNKEICSYCSN